MGPSSLTPGIFADHGINEFLYGFEIERSADRDNRVVVCAWNNVKLFTSCTTFSLELLGLGNGNDLVSGTVENQSWVGNCSYLINVVETILLGYVMARNIVAQPSGKRQRVTESTVQDKSFEVFGH